MVTTGANPEAELAKLLQKGGIGGSPFSNIIGPAAVIGRKLSTVNTISTQKGYTQSMQQKVGEYYREKQK